MNLARQRCSRGGARTFLSAATIERPTALNTSCALSPLPLAADKNVRAPPLTEKSSRLANNLDDWSTRQIDSFDSRVSDFGFLSSFVIRHSSTLRSASTEDGAFIPSPACIPPHAPS